MENVLLSFALSVGVVVVASIINEKKLHMPHDIALLIFATLISIVLLISCLAVLSTLISALTFGGLFYLISLYPSILKSYSFGMRNTWGYDN